MQNIEPELPKWTARQPKLRWDVFLKDLSLFASLWQAQLIVRRTLRRRSKERAARLKCIKLAQSSGDEVLNKVSVDNLGERQC